MFFFLSFLLKGSIRSYLQKHFWTLSHSHVSVLNKKKKIIFSSGRNFFPLKKKHISEVHGIGFGKWSIFPRAEEGVRSKDLDFFFLLTCWLKFQNFPVLLSFMLWSLPDTSGTLNAFPYFFALSLRSFPKPINKKECYGIWKHNAFNCEIQMV